VDAAGRPVHPECPKCGGTGVRVGIGLVEETNVADSLAVQLKPTARPNDWRGRWTDVQASLAVLEKPLSTAMSSDAIFGELRRLMNFFSDAYHLKDAIKLDPIVASPKAVEQAINDEPSLALLADLANLDKHFKLTTPPRSGEAPQVGDPTGQSNQPAGWRLAVTVTHRGVAREGLDIAREAVRAWERVLTGWGAI